MTQKILTYSFYILFFFTPLFWTPYNFELFEYNKMMLVYALTVTIAATWLLKTINDKRLTIKTTPLDIPILLFLGANILSTIFSIDPHVSWWGYYSRSNGGLISIISYTILYFAFVSNFTTEQAIKFLKAAVFGGVVVALYAIPEHFGVSPSCVILTNQFSTSCWVQDVQARVFATLGQPNWLAAYLAMLIFPCIYFALTISSKLTAIRYTLYAILMYLAFTFTYSRGATLGLIGGLAVFFTFFYWHNLQNVIASITKRSFPNFKIASSKTSPNDEINQRKSILIILSAFIVINLLFGSALTSFKLFSKFAPPPRGGIITQAPTSGTQLENGGTESGVIRLIVWRGAWDIFLHYPILGTGVETFAYSYYQFRPQTHNLVSEWDFLYNKAHNEFLNYLANTGLIGFMTYMSIIITFLVFCIKYYVSSIKGNRKSETPNTYYLILIPSLLASYISYLIQNFFGFSVVIIAVFFYLFPAIAFIISGSVKPIVFSPKLLTISKACGLTVLNHKLYTIIYGRPFYIKLTKFIVTVVSGLVIITLLRYYWADTYFATGNNANEAGNPGRAYNQISQALVLNPNEPYYLSELAYSAAASAVALEEDDVTISARLKDEAVRETEKVLKNNPKNTSFFRTAIRTYYLISTLDPGYNQKTLDVLDKTITLAPTDAKLVYNKAIILGQNSNNKEAILNLEKATTLKPNYRDAYYTLGLFLFESASDQTSSARFEDNQKQKAIEQMKKVLQLDPNDVDATEKLKEWSQ